MRAPLLPAAPSPAQPACWRPSDLRAALAERVSTVLPEAAAAPGVASEPHERARRCYALTLGEDVAEGPQRVGVDLRRVVLVEVLHAPAPTGARAWDEALDDEEQIRRVLLEGRADSLGAIAHRIWYRTGTQPTYEAGGYRRRTLRFEITTSENWE